YPDKFISAALDLAVVYHERDAAKGLQIFRSAYICFLENLDNPLVLNVDDQGIWRYLQFADDAEIQAKFLPLLKATA
ncbi:hypothetical protein ABTA82_19930, partial [Acinetobacter baumannii]